MSETDRVRVSVGVRVRESDARRVAAASIPMIPMCCEWSESASKGECVWERA